MLKYSYDTSGNVAMRTVSALLAPQIVGQPVRQIVEQGRAATFSVVVADASGVAYQWLFNGAAIAGATGDSLLMTNVGLGNEGRYSVVVTNSAGSVTSAPAALMLDSDRDGLPDSWEKAKFTDPDPSHLLNPANQRSEGDPDSDGVSNLDECLDGTDPNSSASLRPRLNASWNGHGSVTVAPMKLSYDLGETVTLTATPYARDSFIRWAGDLKGAGNPAFLTMDRNKTVRARFSSAVPIPPGVVALWRGETDASDLIGGHHGAFFGGPPDFTASGKVGGAFDFNSTAPGTVHVEVPDSPELKPAQLTVEAWVFPTARSSQPETPQTIVARGSSTNDFDTWDLRLDPQGRPEFSFHDNSLLQGALAIPLNEWTHLAFTFEKSAFRLYVNGAIVASRDDLVLVLVYDPAPIPVTIGSDWAFNASSALFNGRIDEVTLYNRPLTADEILAIYNADFMGKNFSQPYFTSPAEFPDGKSGFSYTQQVMTILGTGPVSFTLSGGTLPGINISSAGLVSGILGAAGIYDFTVRATDAGGAFTEQACVLRIVV